MQKKFATTEDKVQIQKKSNDSDVQRNLSNSANRVKTTNEFSSSGRYTPPMVDKVSPHNDLLEHSLRLKKNTKQILPISSEELHVGRKIRSEFSQDNFKGIRQSYP